MFHVPCFKKQKGISLIELIVVIFIIVLFTMITIANFPKIQRQYALSGSAYKLAQDLRKVQDMSLSGVSVTDKNGYLIAVKGYGIYVNLIKSTTQYIIYADVAAANGSSDQKYSGDLTYPLCANVNQSVNPLLSDCVIEIININQQNSSLSIQSLTQSPTNATSSYTSINFSPPAPTTKIDGLISGNNSVGIFLQNTDVSTKKVWTNTSGLINVQ